MRTACELATCGAVSRGTGYLFLKRECAEKLGDYRDSQTGLLEALAFGLPDY